MYSMYDATNDFDDDIAFRYHLHTRIMTNYLLWWWWWFTDDDDDVNYDVDDDDDDDDDVNDDDDDDDDVWYSCKIFICVIHI